MRLLCLTLFVCLLSACASPKIIDVEFLPYLRQDVERSSIVFGETGASDDPNETIAGECDYSSHVIRVNRSVWNSLNDFERVWLIRHELGHCELDYLHTEGIDSMGCPAHYMYPQIPSRNCFRHL